MKKTLLTLGAIAMLLGSVGYFLYVNNAAPVVPELASVDESKPYVVKLHAQWCPVCMSIKGVWSEVEQSYGGRVNLLVFDFTNEQTTAATAAEARRLGLEHFYNEVKGVTGPVVVLDGRNKEMIEWINGSRDFRDYRKAIDAALLSMRR